MPNFVHSHWFWSAVTLSLLGLWLRLIARTAKRQQERRPGFLVMSFPSGTASEDARRAAEALLNGTGGHVTVLVKATRTKEESGSSGEPGEPGPLS